MTAERIRRRAALYRADAEILRQGLFTGGKADSRAVVALLEEARRLNERALELEAEADRAEVRAAHWAAFWRGWKEADRG